MNKITLIIPDIHHKWQWAEKIISSVGADEIIFLGDYLDDFNDTPDMVKDTCDWLTSSVDKPNRIHLFGNHDQSYAFQKSLRCSGHEQWKQFIVDDTLPKAVWNKLKWYHWLDNRWLLTHAGLHRLNIPACIGALKHDRATFINEISNYLDVEIGIGLRKANNNETYWTHNAGRARWGQERVGGITWCDYNVEFYPFPGLNQIVGHTPQNEVRWCCLSEDGKVLHHQYDEYVVTPELLNNTNISTNICLDSKGAMKWGVWDGNKFMLGNYIDL
jgi:hypothetical protein